MSTKIRTPDQVTDHEIEAAVAAAIQSDVMHVEGVAGAAFTILHGRVVGHLSWSEIRSDESRAWALASASTEPLIQRIEVEARRQAPTMRLWSWWEEEGVENRPLPIYRDIEINAIPGRVTGITHLPPKVRDIQRAGHWWSERAQVIIGWHDGIEVYRQDFAPSTPEWEIDNAITAASVAVLRSMQQVPA